MNLENILLEDLKSRNAEGRLRALAKDRAGIDFYSNDYLGFARDREFRNKLHQLLLSNPNSVLGSTGSRLISGNSNVIMGVEEYIADRHNFPAALLFPSGYNANLSLFSCLPKKGDTIILDEKVHRSVYDGCRLSNASRWKFRHNDLNHLAGLLKKASGNIWVGIESLYSMDGDFASIKEICALCNHFSAALIVDEAHAMGTFGLGLVHEYELQEQVFAQVVTYGKAMGQSGSAILGSKTLIDYLINYSSSFVYSTGLPDFHALGIKESYLFLDNNLQLVSRLQDRIRRFHGSESGPGNTWLSPIVPLYFSESQKLNQALMRIKERGILSYAIRIPTVAPNEEMLRISLHAFNTDDEINLLKDTIKEIRNG